MVIHSALVRSHQSTSLVASASCVPRGYNTRAQPCLKMWRGSPDLPAQRPRRLSRARSPRARNRVHSVDTRPRRCNVDTTRTTRMSAGRRRLPRPYRVRLYIRRKSRSREPARAATVSQPADVLLTYPISRTATGFFLQASTPLTPFLCSFCVSERTSFRSRPFYIITVVA